MKDSPGTTTTFTTTATTPVDVSANASNADLFSGNGYGVPVKRKSRAGRPKKVVDVIKKEMPVGVAVGVGMEGKTSGIGRDLEYKHINKTEFLKWYHNNGGNPNCIYKAVKLQYQEADEYCVVNAGDRNLIPIYIPLPKAPRWDLIDGFGLNASEQYFRYQQVPYKLRQLEKDFDTIDQMWSEIESNVLYYREEIEWIKKQIWHELNGYWFYCNGKPTYLPGDYYVYLNFWTLDKGKPEYRDRDRKMFLFDEFIERDERFAGLNYPKHRREGATSKAGFKNYIRISRLINSYGGIQSKTTEHAKMVFIKHIIQPWRQLCFIFKPEYDGTDMPKEILSFVPPASTTTKDARGKKSGLVAKSHGLGGNITFRSSDKYSYDAYLLHFYHGDEVGKTKDVDTNERYFLIRECLAEGEFIHGHCWNTSTVEDMDAEGGRNFKNTCDKSHYHDIFTSKTGRTISWLANLFIPAYEGRKGFIGKYGESIIHDPTPEQIEFLKNKDPNRRRFIGAMEDIANHCAEFEEKGDTIGLMAYKRKYPIEYSDCWISSNFDTGMPHDVIHSRMSELSIMLGSKSQQLVRTGDFVRTGTSQFAPVSFVDSPNGRFEISWWFEDEKFANRFTIQEGEPMPSNLSWGIAGADPYKFTKTKNRRFSNGGGSLFMYRDPNDRDEDIENWEGHRFVVNYNYKPPTFEEYCQDMAMMIQYYGVYMCAENNVNALNEWLLNNGYRHYLKYLLNKKTGRFEVNPGVYTSEETKQKLWGLIRDYLRVHGHRERHMGFLKECTDIEGIEKMTDYDLFTACGMALIGADEQIYDKMMEGESELVALDDWF